MNLAILSIVLIMIILWYSYMELCKFGCENKIYLEKLLDRNFDTAKYPEFNDTAKYPDKKDISVSTENQSSCAAKSSEASTILKTGDLILFKAKDNFHSSIMFNYFTHIGLVVVDEVLTHNKPYIFEACPTKYMNIPHDRPDTWNAKFSKGILFQPLEERLKRYRGYIYYKPLSKPITNDMKMGLINFIYYALNNMEYDYKVPLSLFRKIFMGGKCNDKTNCAEFVFLSLIHAGLLNDKLWHYKTVHYLKWMCELTRLKNLYTYDPIVEIIKVVI